MIFNGFICAVLFLLIVILSFTSEKRYLQFFDKILKKDAPISALKYFIFFVVVLIFEIALSLIFRLPFKFVLPFIIISIYLPLTFYFYCNIYKIGNRREIIWALSFILLCFLSLMFFDFIHIFVILPITISFAVYLCYSSGKDPAIQNSNGEFYLKFKKYEDAKKCFKSAMELDENEPLYLYNHLLSELYQGKDESIHKIIELTATNKTLKDRFFKEEIRHKYIDMLWR